MTDDIPRFAWTRHKAGNWSAHGYEIKRDYPDQQWRILRDGAHWDLAWGLFFAKRQCERDYAKRQKERA